MNFKNTSEEWVSEDENEISIPFVQLKTKNRIKINFFLVAINLKSFCENFFEKIGYISASTENCMSEEGYTFILFQWGGNPPSHRLGNMTRII